MKRHHLAAMLAEDGSVSPACASEPRAINLAKETWTLRPEAVTCQACKLTDRFQRKAKQAAALDAD